MTFRMKLVFDEARVPLDCVILAGGENVGGAEKKMHSPTYRW